MQTIKEHIPCLPCLLAIGKIRLPEVHHLVSGMRREGHDKTIALCEWHHQRIKPDDRPEQEIMSILGPSLAQGKRTFALYFGTEQQLLKVQDWLLKQFNDEPWIDYDIPSQVRSDAIIRWLQAL